jgi:hypothetical protein
MNWKLFAAALLAASLMGADLPAGRWDGVIEFGKLKVPVMLRFEGAGASYQASLVNGDSRVTASSTRFESGQLIVSFAGAGSRLEGALSETGLKGSFIDARRQAHPFTASAYCTCSLEGEAGPELSGEYAVAGSDWRLSLRRQGEDTLVTLYRGAGVLGPLAGRFDGLSFSLRYFDGARAATLDIEPRKDGGLDLLLAEPGQEVQKRVASRSSASR